MYPALWRLLPGNRWLKSLEALVLFLAVVALLFLVVFPRVTPLLPYENVTVQTPSSTASPSASTSTPSSPGATPGATP